MISLPIDEKIPGILKTFKNHSNLVLTAAPGAGKTTRLPPALLEITGKQVWVLEPRRMAAVAAAFRIADERKWNLGEDVGYQVRFESRVQKNTRLIFLTEALLARKILADPDISDCGIIVLDEFHERSLHVDLALGLIKELQILSRPDLKILVMSATIDAKPLSLFLGKAPTVEVPGKLYELEMQYAKTSQLMRTDHRFIERMVDAILQEVQSYPNRHDILVFLPGMSEISRTQKILEEKTVLKDFLILPLSGSLTLEAQLKALRPTDRRKIILTTNVAESSVTVDGVDTVIDCGLARDVELHSKTGFEKIEIRRISKASAKQRAGRSARQYPGRCLQLWTKMDELSMPEFDIGEIHRRDLSETVLMLHGLGVTNPQEFSWFEKPEIRKLQRAEDFLKRIGAVENGNLSALGKRLVSIPLHPRLGKLLLRSEEMQIPTLGSQICALLQEKDILRQSSGTDESECDICERVEVLRSHPSSAKSVIQVSQQLRKLVAGKDIQPKIESASIKDLLLEAYPDRICRRRNLETQTAVMVGGRGVELAKESSAQNSEFFIAIEMMETSTADSQVRKASGVSRNQIEMHYRKEIHKKSRIVFDENLKNYFVEEYLELWDMPLEDPRRRPAKAEEVSSLLPEILMGRWNEVLKLNPVLDSWYRRWLYFEKDDAEKHFTDKILKSIFEQASLGETKFEAVAEKDLVYFFESTLDPMKVSDFHKNCPEKFQVPSGSWIDIHYHLDKNPHLEVRLQELFGLASTPTVMSGKIPITIHLLAPNYRPVQVTSDLMSFWRNAYVEVKKELKARYPKHSWPEDPMTAPPQAKGRKRN